MNETNTAVRTHTKRSAAFKSEIESLIEKHLNRQWAGDSEGAGISRIIEILRNNTTDAGCVVKAGEDEPIFTLRGKDVTADKCVDVWCEYQIERTLTETADQHLINKINDARKCASEMREYTSRKYPD